MAKSKKNVVKLDADALEREVKKQFGEGAVRRASDPSLRITRIPTGILSVDDVTGGGIPRGRYTEIFGPFGVGKTALTYRLIAMAQSMGLKCKFYDPEHGFDPTFAGHLGVDNDELGTPEFEDGNELVNQMEIDLRSRLYDVVVVDSIASLLPKAEREKASGDGTMGTEQARLMSGALRRLTSANSQTAIVMLNQLRQNIGVMFGKRTSTTGGMAMGFYSGLRLEIVRTENIKATEVRVDYKTGKDKKESVTVGHRALVRVEKDKTGGATTHDTGTFVYNYKIGNFDPIEDLIWLGRNYGFINVKGDTWWVDEYDDDKVTGRARFKSFLKKQRAVREELEENLRPWIYREVEAEARDEEDDDDEEDEDE